MSVSHADIVAMQNAHDTGGLFHSKGAWVCAAPKGTLFRTSSLAKGIYLGNPSDALRNLANFQGKERFRTLG